MSLLRDLRYGARSLLKSPGLIFVATLALGFGIGLTATMWSIIYGAMLKGLPLDEPQSFVASKLRHRVAPRHQQPWNSAASRIPRQSAAPPHLPLKRPDCPTMVTLRAVPA